MSYCLVLGDPISHSLSPVIHLAAYNYLGLDWQFHRVRVAAGNLGEYLSSLEQDCMGLAVTMPLKPEALAVATYQDSLAQVTGAANTLVPAAGNTWAAFNTDVAGIVGAFHEVLPPDFKRFDSPFTRSGHEGLIFGSGSTAASGIAALVQLGVTRLTVVSRTASLSSPACVGAAAMGVDISLVTWDDSSALAQAAQDAELVMNTVPGGQQASLCLPVLNPQARVLEVAYAPWPTRVASWVLDSGARLIPGWRMLLHQALSQIKLITGHEADLEILADSLQSAIK